MPGETPIPPSRSAGARDEQATLYRRIAELSTALAESEACVLRGRGREAATDEMNGQMLARVSDVEMRLRATEDALREALSRTQRAEARAVDLAGQLTREQEAREMLRLRLAELVEVCDERDGALIREELLQVELEEVRHELRAVRDAHEAELTSLREKAVPAAEAPESAGLRADRDALAAEARQLRTVVDAIARALGELKQPPRETAAPDAPDAPEDEPTRVFGAPERELVRSLGRR
jgi:chromosome segregation ATPase